jgi:hypothetical protein
VSCDVDQGTPQATQVPREEVVILHFAMQYIFSIYDLIICDNVISGLILTIRKSSQFKDCLRIEGEKWSA